MAVSESQQNVVWAWKKFYHLELLITSGSVRTFWFYAVKYMGNWGPGAKPPGKFLRFLRPTIHEKWGSGGEAPGKILRGLRPKIHEKNAVLEQSPTESFEIFTP